MRDSDWAGECFGVPFLARVGQGRLRVGEGRIALVEAGPILRMDWDFGFLIWFVGICVIKKLVAVGYRELP